MADSTSAIVNYSQDRIKALRSLHKLQGILLSKASKLDFEHVHFELERLIHADLDFDSFELDDHIMSMPTILGTRLTHALAATGTIVTFRQLTTYQESELREVRGVGDGDILRIQAALASQGAACAVIVDWDEWVREYGRIIPENMPGGHKRYAMVRIDHHEPIAFKSVWTWAGIDKPFPHLGETDTSLQTLGQLLQMSRTELRSRIYEWTVSQAEGWRQQFASESADKLHEYIKNGTRLSWEFYNDDLLFATGFDVLSDTIRDVLRAHELYRVGDLRRFLGEGIKLSQMDPGLGRTSWHSLAAALWHVGARALASQITSSI